MSTARQKFLIFAVAAAIVAAFAGYIVGRRQAPHAPPTAAAAEAQLWTCSMHPSIQQPDPGACPICGMDLIPLETDGSADLAPRQLKLSAAARKLADVQVAPVERREVTHRLRLVGTVDYDETRVATISSWVSGRLDRLYVDYTGIPVTQGDHMVWMYSPEILAAQEELLQAQRRLAEFDEDSVLRRSAEATLEATRDKLRLWGLTDEQVAAIGERGTPSDHIMITAPIGGIVIHKNAVQGEYVQTGTPIYRIADLSQVWVLLDAYESDLPWLHYGQEVTFSAEALPGETFQGRISFIDPVLTDRTRTVKVRVIVENESGRLKPNMFVRAVVEARLAAGGKVIDPDLAGKWISPMHPEIIKDEPGTCDVCGMPLVKAEELGYVSASDAAETTPLVIPASAPLLTGTRAVVYVRDPRDEGLFTGREVELGARAGDWYLVEEGLEEGELVVVNGNFKIDSALQIRAKPSMMSPPAVSAAAEAPDLPAAFGSQFDTVVNAYLEVGEALSVDDHAAAQTAADRLTEAVDAVETRHVRWTELAGELRQSAAQVAASENIAAAREAFVQLSASIATAASRFGHRLTGPLYKLECPMAFENRGAMWLDSVKDIENPYFGAAMYSCGAVIETLVEPPAEEHHHE